MSCLLCFFVVVVFFVFFVCFLGRFTIYFILMFLYFSNSFLFIIGLCCNEIYFIFIFINYIYIYVCNVPPT